MKMKEMIAEDRPRERLLEKGAGALGTAELIAILLRIGNGRKNVLETARELISSAGDLTGLSSMSVDKMIEIPGIGRNKAATISAAFELGRRFASEKTRTVRSSVTSPKQVYDELIPVMRGLDHEECWIIYLNRSNYIIGKERQTSGGLSATVIDTGTIVRKALEKKANGIILAHNHPSGNPYPGTSDIRETEKLKKAADTCGISLLDHIIISDNRYYSFADEQIRVAEVQDSTLTVT
jgi:DNA repair protein RadC